MRKAPQRMYLCRNGPLDGVRLSLATPATMAFTVKGQLGRYRPALFVLKCYDLQGSPYTVTVKSLEGHNHKPVRSEIRYQDEPVGKDIYWEEL